MPGIKFTSFYNMAQNPSYSYVPYNTGGSFADSPIFLGEDYLYTVSPSGNAQYGTNLDFGANNYYIGEPNSYIAIGSGVSGIEIKGQGILSGSAFGFATHLIISVNGSDRKIKLLKVTP